MKDDNKLCPDCHCSLDAITMMGATRIFLGKPMSFAELTYGKEHVVMDLLGTQATLGKIKGWLCPQCNRVLLYAEPHPKKA